VSRVQLQRGFVGFIAPLHCGLAAALPGLGQLAGRLERTRAMWERLNCDSDWDEGDLPASALPASELPA
jgi:hypothetical protein